MLVMGKGGPIKHAIAQSGDRKSHRWDHQGEYAPLLGMHSAN